MTKTTHPIETFRGLIASRGLHASRQRDLIVEEFFKHEKHLTIEEWLALVRKKDEKVGYVTVYRTLKLLEACGLAFQHKFSGRVSFEPVVDEHHHHLICITCGKIAEFKDTEIESFQTRICKENHFQLVDHKLEFYGYCRGCSKKKGKKG